MRNRKEGFTLIELLIVIAIIGILAAVLIPNLLDARRRAVDAGADACLKEITTQAEVVFIDTDGYASLVDNIPPSCDSQLAQITSEISAGGYVVTLANPIGGSADYNKTVGSNIAGLQEN